MGPPIKVGPGADNAEAQPTSNPNRTSQFSLSSRQVAWLTVHQFVQHVLAEAGAWPTVGTPAWNLLDDNDPVKIAAVYDAGQHWALHLELNQEARAEASRDVSGAADWPAIAREIQAHNEFYAAKPYLKRVAS
jgi:Protein of unknown function (DUF2742)